MISCDTIGMTSSMISPCLLGWLDGWLATVNKTILQLKSSVQLVYCTRALLSCVLLPMQMLSLPPYMAASSGWLVSDVHFLSLPGYLP